MADIPGRFVLQHGKFLVERTIAHGRYQTVEDVGEASAMRMKSCTLIRREE